MKPGHIHIICIALTLVGSGFIAFLYTTEPRTLAEVGTKSQVALGTYSIDKAAFDQGLASFRKDEFVAARAAFERADPEKRDAATQYYIAYSYYRQGWGRVSNDDALFTAGLEAVNRVMSIEPSFVSADETLGLRSPAELRNELEEGLKLTPSDFNPMRLTRERK